VPEAVRLADWFSGAGRCGGAGAGGGQGLVAGLFGHNLMVYGSLGLVAAVWWLLYRTRFGLRLRAAGENPTMVDAAGVSVVKALRYQALALNGVLSALAGATS
jgi:ABC-type uncharacterized transport system permease subunit